MFLNKTYKITRQISIFIKKIPTRQCSHNYSKNEPTLGPDQILPSNSYTTTKPDGAVILRTNKHAFGSKKPMSVHSMFRETVRDHGDHLALSVKRDGIWKKWNYHQYYEETNILARAFIKLGLERFYGVCVMGFNSPEWFMAHNACVFCGGLGAGVYTTSSADACRHIADNCRAQIIVVENKEYLDKFLSVKEFLPHVKVIIQWLGKPEPGVLSWSEVMAIGKLESDEQLQERLSLQAVNQCCTVIYTSGTTGPPKGVMLSQDQCTWGSQTLIATYGVERCKEIALSYLPLSHVAGQIFEMYVPLRGAFSSYFADPDCLKGTLGQSMKEVQPTYFVGIPRVWEKIYEKLQEVGLQSGPIKRGLGKWAKRHNENYFNAFEYNKKLSMAGRIQYYAASKFMNLIKDALGLGRCTHFLTGAAPISMQILNYFKSIGIPIMNNYGMTENGGIGTINVGLAGTYRMGSVGKLVPSLDMKLLGVGNYGPGEGEICMTGRTICMGYLQMPEATKSAICEDGWLHTGDLGSLDEDGYLFLTGRLKELVITAGGENIPPVLIENLVKEELPCVSNCMLIGDHRKYLSMLLTLKAEVDPITSDPLQELSIPCMKWMESIGSTAKTVNDAIDDVKRNPEGPLANAIQQGFNRYNNQATSNPHKIQKWTILPHDFSVPTNELSSTLKLKRSAVIEKYSAEVESMYAKSRMG